MLRRRSSPDIWIRPRRLRGAALVERPLSGKVQPLAGVACTTQRALTRCTHACRGSSLRNATTDMTCYVNGAAGARIPRPEAMFLPWRDSVRRCAALGVADCSGMYRSPVPVAIPAGNATEFSLSVRIDHATFRSIPGQALIWRERKNQGK